MKKMKKYLTFKNFVYSSMLTVGLFMVDPLTAGTPPGPGDPGNQPGCPPTCVPIDGGLSLLIAAGAALSGKKLYNQFKA